MEVIFSSYGNTGVFEGDEQVPELQKSWLLLFAEFLNKHGIDPTAVAFTLPNGNRCKIFEVPDGCNWRIDAQPTLRMKTLEGD